jgi:hypothetical protein
LKLDLKCPGFFMEPKDPGLGHLSTLSSGSAYMDSKVTSLLPQPLWICNMQQEGFEFGHGARRSCKVGALFCNIWGE